MREVLSWYRELGLDMIVSNFYATRKCVFTSQFQQKGKQSCPSFGGLDSPLLRTAAL